MTQETEEQDASKGYPIRDFRDAAGYPSWKDTTAWRWEFLRRNREYQAAYDEFGSIVPPPPICWKFGLRTFPNPRHEYEQVISDFQPGGAFIEFPTLESLAKWKSRPSFDAERVLYALISTFEGLKLRGQVLAAIDVNVPIKPQLAKLEAMNRRKPTVERLRPKEWREYLRILDACAEGLTNDDIAKVLYPHETNSYGSGFGPRHKVAKARDRALALCSGFAIGIGSPEK